MIMTQVPSLFTPVLKPIFFHKPSGRNFVSSKDWLHGLLAVYHFFWAEHMRLFVFSSFFLYFLYFLVPHVVAFERTLKYSYHIISCHLMSWLLSGVWWERRQESGTLSVPQLTFRRSLCAVSPAAMVSTYQHESRAHRLPIQRFLASGILVDLQ